VNHLCLWTTLLQGNASVGLADIVLKAEDSYEEMTLDEIFNGKDNYYPGLIPLIYAYLDFMGCEPETFYRLDQYLKFISRYKLGISPIVVL